jgi:release factor glutamine methyltransferase
MQRRELQRELAAVVGADHEARFIVDEVVGRGATEVDADGAIRARELAARRAAGEPLQYVLGHWAFRALDLLVDPRVLIPRPETEQVVEEALAEVRALGTRDAVVVDAGTGSGAIALALAIELAAAGDHGEVFATDASGAALQVARANLARVSAVSAAMWPVTMLEGNWLEPLPEERRGCVSAVVSNPPYVAESEWADLDAEVHAEPRTALLAAAGSDGTPGLADVEAVLVQSLSWLARPGVVVIELAPAQADAARSLALALGYAAVAVHQDLAGRPRTLVASAE